MAWVLWNLEDDSASLELPPAVVLRVCEGRGQRRNRRSIIEPCDVLVPGDFSRFREEGRIHQHHQLEELLEEMVAACALTPRLQWLRL